MPSAKTSPVASRQVSAALGTEFLNLDLREEQPSEVVDAIRAAFLGTGMVLVRGQELTFDQQMRFASYVGTPTKRTPKGFVPNDELPTHVQYISNTRPDGYAREGNLLKHSDYCFEQQILLGVCLYSEVVAEHGGDTILVNQKAAADHLAPELRARLEGVQVRHVWDMDAPEDGFKKYDIAGKSRVCSYVRPALINHPITNENLLYVNELMTDRVEGLPAAESTALLQEISDHLDKPAFRYDHRWEVGDVMAWDNIKLQHGRTYMPPGDRRSMRRLMIDVPVQA
jgi:taurine dioxygenase